MIPKPVSVVATGGKFDLTDQTDIYIQDESAELKQIGQYLADKLNPSTGLGLEVKPTTDAPAPGNIYLSLSGSDSELGDEGYQLTITDKLISLSANKPAGLFHGIQTIRQLLPAQVEMTSKQKGPWEIATGTIRDYPTYGYRGSMLDVARHFFGVDDLKNLIDQMAYYKMNVMHLHLSDDQGWRIEIKSWPNLTAHGGKTEVGGGEGGFYTQEQYSDIVKYAQDRFITIIPEIDMPGHTNAASASYPELNGNGKTADLYTGTEVGFSTLATKKEVTYKFIDDVIRELAALTPGEYLHIGGDESHATKIEDYIPFMNRVQDMVVAHGKKVLAWDEIALATVKPNTVVQYWAKAENAIKGVAQGAKVLMSPAKNAYLDMQYDSTSTYGLHWAAYIEVDKGYNWDPANLVPEIKKENITGIEAPLWSETVGERKEAEYLIFPRLLGYAEIGWTPAELRNWDDYKIRLANHGERMKAMNINFYPSKLVQWDVKKEK
ncbi:beta-hexosaminidase [Aquipluma nitroreducens]|uniref:beta-N-acetylhexosaminidase n=2 Tax=Aquipluma nitroreducens TaxID=2010828 RepID=A0A5K7S6Z6_9BACT|nr:beta-hexosaminidase [Aquipluma nitroreducens]